MGKDKKEALTILGMLLEDAQWANPKLKQNIIPKKMTINFRPRRQVRAKKIGNTM